MVNKTESSQRRYNLIVAMEQLERGNINCQGCSGVCCTFKKNSMMMTPIETQDLYNYLNDHHLFTSDLVRALENNIKEFRLDYDLATTRTMTFRRTYTCPFFKNQSLGCPLPVEVKPYGCLAFNPLSEKSGEGVGCESDLKALEKRELQDVQEQQTNEQLKNKLALDWDKLPIPVALLKFHKAVAQS